MEVDDAKSNPPSYDQIQNKMSKTMNQLGQLLKAEEKKLESMRQEMKQIEKCHEQYRQLVTKFRNPIRLDVGGVHYTTTIETLTAMKDRNDMLSTMFSGKYSLKPDNIKKNECIKSKGTLVLSQ